MYHPYKPHKFADFRKKRAIFADYKSCPIVRGCRGNTAGNYDAVYRRYNAHIIKRSLAAF